MDAHRQSALAGRSVGDYELSAALGGGPFGQVFVARHRTRGYPCAVKLFDPGRCSPAALRSSVEATTVAAALPHCGARPLLDARVDGPSPFFALDLVAGESLDNLRRRHDRVAWDHARVLVAGVAACLAAAHRGGLVHGNLKPTNIFTLDGPDAQPVRLLDWSLGRPGDADGDTRADLGLSVDYHAPELLAGSPPTPASDLYALGIVLFELVTGVRPFQGGPNVVAMHHMRTPPPSPRIHAPELSQRAEALVLQLLDKDPRRRPASAGSLAEQLRSDGDDEPATAIFVRPVRTAAEPAQPDAPPAVTEVTLRTARQPEPAGITVVTPKPGTQSPQTETVVLARPQQSEAGGVTLVLDATRGPVLLDTDPGVLARSTTGEDTAVSNNASATVFVKQVPSALLRPAVHPSPAPSRWPRWLRGPWSFEKKLLALNVLLGLIILVGFGMYVTAQK